MKCKKCGNEVVEGQKFCAVCGSKSDEQSTDCFEAESQSIGKETKSSVKELLKGVKDKVAVFVKQLFENLKNNPIQFVAVTVVAAILTSAVVAPVSACSKSTTAMNILDSDDARLYAYDNEYDFGNYDKYNSPASENGMEGVKVYIKGTIEKMEKIDSFNYALVSEDNAPENKWTVLFIEEEIKEPFEIGMTADFFCYYSGFSDVTETPAVYFEKAILDGEWVVYDDQLGVLSMIANSPEVIIKNGGFIHGEIGTLNKLSRLFDCDFFVTPVKGNGILYRQKFVSDYTSVILYSIEKDNDNAPSMVSVVCDNIISDGAAYDFGTQIGVLLTAIFDEEELEENAEKLNKELKIESMYEGMSTICVVDGISFILKVESNTATFSFIPVDSVTTQSNTSDETTAVSSADTTTTTTTTVATTTTTEAPVVEYYYEDNYKVGTDIPAGTYFLQPTSYISAYMCISSDANQDDIIENDNFDGQRYIEVKSGQYLELSRCYAISAEYAPKAEPDADGYLSEGMYKVGYDIPAGEYKLAATSEYGGYCAIYNKPLGTGKIQSNDNFDSSKYVTVKKGQYLYLSRAKVKVK